MPSGRYRLILDFPLLSGDLRTVLVGQFFDIAGEQLLEFDRGGERVGAHFLGVGHQSEDQVCPLCP